MQTTLELLQGPTRLLVGSALTGLAAELALTSRQPAHCYVFKPTYDDEAFQSIYGGPTQQALASSKPKRPVGVVALRKLTAPSNLAVIVGRNVGLATLVTVNRWLVAALEEEDAADAEGREPEMPQLSVEELQAAAARGVYNACVDVAVQATRAGLDAAAADRLQPQLAKRLIKDLRLSAVRKGRLAWYLRAPRVARTALYSEATLWAADFLVSSALEARMLLLKSGGALDARLRRLALRCSLHAVRAVVVLAAVALGNGVGSASPRFRGLAMWLGSLGASFAANGYMLALINRWAPAGGGGAAAQGGSAAPAAGDAPRPASPPQQAPPVARGGAAAHGFLLVGQAMHPDVQAAIAAGAGGGAPPAEAARDADGPEAQRGGAAAAGQPPEAAGGQAGGVQPEAVGQAGAPEADAPPIPAPQQRRVVGGPRLPERPARRPAAAALDRLADPAAAGPAGRHAPLPPQPAAPATPQFRLDQRAPTPAGDAEEAEARAAAAAAGGASGSPAASASGRSSVGSSLSAAGQQVQA